MSESFRDDTETNKLLSEALNNLMKPYGGNILQVSDRAALRYASIFSKNPQKKYELYWVFIMKKLRGNNRRMCHS